MDVSADSDVVSEDSVLSSVADVDASDFSARVARSACSWAFPRKTNIWATRKPQSRTAAVIPRTVLGLILLVGAPTMVRFPSECSTTAGGV